MGAAIARFFDAPGVCGTESVDGISSFLGESRVGRLSPNVIVSVRPLHVWGKLTMMEGSVTVPSVALLCRRRAATRPSNPSEGSYSNAKQNRLQQVPCKFLGPTIWPESLIPNSFTCRASRQGSLKDKGYPRPATSLAFELVHLPREAAGVSNPSTED